MRMLRQHTPAVADNPVKEAGPTCALPTSTTFQDGTITEVLLMGKGLEDMMYVLRTKGVTGLITAIVLEGPLLLPRGACPGVIAVAMKADPLSLHRFNAAPPSRGLVRAVVDL